MGIIKDKTLVSGLIFTIASAVFTIAVSDTFFFEGARLQPYLFDAGVDTLGALVCAGLYYGCMTQDGEGGRTFRTLVVIISASFSANLAMYFTTGLQAYSGWHFAFVMIAKLLDLAMIYHFYRYVRATLDFEGKLARWAARGIPVLLGIEVLIILSNIIHPLTFVINDGAYEYTSFSWIEDIFLLVTSLITTVMVIKSKSMLGQKVAALTFS